MAKTYSAVVTATGDNIAFQIEVSNIEHRTSVQLYSNAPSTAQSGW